MPTTYPAEWSRGGSRVVWVVFAEIPAMRRWHSFRMIVAGVLLAVAGLLIVAVPDGQLGWLSY